jgi:hypothetical protein
MKRNYHAPTSKATRVTFSSLIEKRRKLGQQTAGKPAWSRSIEPYIIASAAHDLNRSSRSFTSVISITQADAKPG